MKEKFFKSIECISKSFLCYITIFLCLNYNRGLFNGVEIDGSEEAYMKRLILRSNFTINSLLLLSLPGNKESL